MIKKFNLRTLNSAHSLHIGRESFCRKYLGNKYQKIHYLRPMCVRCAILSGTMSFKVSHDSMLTHVLSQPSLGLWPGRPSRAADGKEGVGCRRSAVWMQATKTIRHVAKKSHFRIWREARSQLSLTYTKLWPTGTTCVLQSEDVLRLFGNNSAVQHGEIKMRSMKRFSCCSHSLFQTPPPVEDSGVPGWKNSAKSDPF